jgi:hypothetical protein
MDEKRDERAERENCNPLDDPGHLTILPEIRTSSKARLTRAFFLMGQ